MVTIRQNLMTTPMSLLLKSENESSMIFLSTMDNETSALAYHPVDSCSYSQLAAFIMLFIGGIGNFLGTLIFLGCSKKTLVVDRVLGLLCLTGLSTTLTYAPLHIFAQLAGGFPSDPSLCQIQGLLLHLFCLISLWFSAVLATERLFRLVSPHEHRLTFSPLNLNVILSGIFVLLLVEVSGPIYGWAEYAYLKETTVCLLDPKSKHIFTYSVIHVSCYVALPILATTVGTGLIVREGIKGNPKLSMGSKIFRSPRSHLIIAVAMIITVILFIPYHVGLLLQANLVSFSYFKKVVSFWLHMLSITCVYPFVLFTIGAREVYPALGLLFKDVRMCKWFERSAKEECCPTQSSNDLEVRKLVASTDVPQALQYQSGATEFIGDSPLTSPSIIISS